MIKNIFLIVSLLALGCPAIAAESGAGQGEKAASQAIAPQSNKERTAKPTEDSSHYDCGARRNSAGKCLESPDQNNKQDSRQFARPEYFKP